MTTSTAFARTPAAALLALLVVLTAGSTVPLRAADRPVVNLATVTQEIGPWCLTTGFVYKPAFIPATTHGVEIDFNRVFLGPAQAVIAVDSGDVALDECVGIATIVQAWKKGAHNFVIVAVSSLLPPYVMIGAKNIKPLEDLKGKSIGSNGPETTATKAIEAILQHGANLLPDRDYTFVASGSTGARAAALRAGKLDAISTTPPYDYKLEDDGFTLLGRQHQYVPNNVEGVLVANRTWLQKNPQLMVAILKELTEVGKWLKDPAKKNDVIAKMAENITLGDAPVGAAYAARIYNEFIGVEGGIVGDGHADRPLFQAALNLLLADGTIARQDFAPLDQLVDYRYLNQARHELGLPPFKQLAP